MDRGLGQGGAEITRITRSRLILAGPPGLFLTLFYLYPLGRIFWVSFTAEGPWGPIDWTTLGEKAGPTLWFTFWQAGLSTILTLIAALPGAYIFSRFKFKGQDLIWSLTIIPFVLPTVVVASAFQSLFGQDGLLDAAASALGHPGLYLEHSIGLVLLAHVFYNYSLVLRLVGGAWSRLETCLGEAARMLGASPWQTFVKITWPLLRPSIYAATVLIFMFCFTSFGLILILGGPRLTTVEVAIYRQAVDYFNLPLAAVLSLIQLVFTFGLMWVYSDLARRASVTLNPEAQAIHRRPPTSSGQKLLIWLNLLFMGFLLGLPLLALVIQAVSTDHGFSFRYFLALLEQESQSIFFISTYQALMNSLGFALATVILSVGLGILAAMYLAGPTTRWSSFLDPLYMLPLSTSAVTLGFGFILALDRPPLNLRTSVALVPLAHTLVAFPLVVRAMLPALRSLPVSLREAAAVLGASPRQVWRYVDLPIISRAILAGAMFALAVSLGEFGATTFVARPQTATLPLAIFRFLGHPGVINYGRAMALSCVLVLVTGVAAFVMEKARLGPREF